MASPETITVDNTTAICDGGGALGHPRVYLSLAKQGQATCPYCGREFVLRPGARTGHGH